MTFFLLRESPAIVEFWILGTRKNSYLWRVEMTVLLIALELQEHDCEFMWRVETEWLVASDEWLESKPRL